MTSILCITLRSQLVVSGAIKYNILLCIKMKMMIATRVKNKDKEGNAPQHTSHACTRPLFLGCFSFLLLSKYMYADYKLAVGVVVRMNGWLSFHVSSVMAWLLPNVRQGSSPIWLTEANKFYSMGIRDWIQIQFYFDLLLQLTPVLQ